jgi:hypothetical protein
VSELDNFYNEAPTQLKLSLASILDRKLTAGIIEDYAESALSSLAELTSEAAFAYQQYPVIYFDTEKGFEDAAFRYFGLNQVEEAIDHISDKALEIQQLDEVIAKACIIDQVIIPPDDLEMQGLNGEGEFKQNKTVPRLKTTLFILQNDFSLDPSDDKQVKITHGEIEDEMIRSTSYYLIEASAIKRTIMVCDEEGNATFIFNNDRLEQSNLSSESLISMSKLELKKLIYEDPSIGQRIIYSENYVPYMIAALNRPDGSQQTLRIDTAVGKYLAPKAPEGVHSLSGIMMAFNIPTRPIIEKTVDDLADILGEVRFYKFGPRLVPGYTPHQQEMIREYLETKGYFRRAPEGYQNRFNMHKSFGVVYPVIERAIDALGEDLGEIGTYMASAGSTSFFSPRQLELIRSKLEEMETLRPDAPEGYLSIAGIAKALGIDHSTVVASIERISEELGEIQKYKFTNNISSAFSPSQQNLIRGQLESDGLLVSVAPDGVLSINGLTKLLGLSTSKAVKRTIDELGDTLGDLAHFRFGSRRMIAQGLTQVQQTIIVNRLKESGALDLPPEGYANIIDLSIRLETESGLVRKVIKEISEELGEVKKYKGGSGAIPFFTPEQQVTIRSRLDAAGYLNNLPPEGFVTATTIGKEHNHNHSTIAVAIEKLGEDLGEVKSYKYKTLVTPGYSPVQQAMIIAFLEKR